MTDFVIRQGLTLPVDGSPIPPSSRGVDIIATTQVGVNGYDARGLKPKVLVTEGDNVLKGQPIFNHKDNSAIVFTAPKAGTVAKITRGHKRFLEAVVIDVDSKDPDKTHKQALPSKAYSHTEITKLESESVKKMILAAGLWPSLRTRPFSKMPLVDSTPKSIFITATDTSPNASDPRYAIELEMPAFEAGLLALSRLSPKLHLCLDGGANLAFEHIEGTSDILQHHFSGPHPSGLAGTHIHFIDPVSIDYTVWYIGYQEVIAIGKLLLEQTLYTDRIIALSGPAALHPRIIKTTLGASIQEVAKNEIPSSRAIRIISGCILNGQRLSKRRAFLSRFHNQISLLFNDPPREFMGWIVPSFHKFSTSNVHLSSIFGYKNKKIDFSTNLNGSPRAMVPFGQFEEVFPIHNLPTQLLRYLLVLDTDMAQSLDCLELDEEDLALCSYCCLSKYEYGIALRATLEKIEKEG